MHVLYPLCARLCAEWPPGMEVLLPCLRGQLGVVEQGQ